VATLDSLETDSCELTPAFSKGDKNASCCALRPTKSVTVRPVADAFDHSTASPTSETVPLSKETPSAIVQIKVTSFDKSSEEEYPLLMAWVPGDVHCVNTSSVPCYNASGLVQPCISQTLYPVHELVGTMPCITDPVTAPHCSYAQFDFSKCTCPACRPNFVYACHCDGMADGSIACDENGELTKCDCRSSYAYPPAAPPPYAPPPSPPPSKAGLIAGVVVASLVALAGLCCGLKIYRRRRARRFEAAYSNLLLDPVRDVDVTLDETLSRPQEGVQQQHATEFVRED